VSGNSPDRVVDAQFLVDEFDEEDRSRCPGQDADDERPRCTLTSITAGRNSHQASQAAVESHGYVGLAIADPCRQSWPSSVTGSGSDIGRKEDMDAAFRMVVFITGQGQGLSRH
jgi:hypothetical protein